jgi:hypothetical protein
VGYEWVAKALDALRGIEPHEVMQALGSTARWPRLARTSMGQPVLTVWARTHAGRPLIVAVRPIDEWSWQILGAREMRAAELGMFEKWEASQ